MRKEVSHVVDRCLQVTVHTRERGDGTDTYDWIEDTSHPNATFDDLEWKILIKGVGRRFRATVDPRGHVVALPSVKQELERLRDELGDLTPDDDKYAREVIRERFGMRSTVTTLNQIFSTYKIVSLATIQLSI